MRLPCHLVQLWLASRILGLIASQQGFWPSWWPFQPLPWFTLFVWLDHQLVFQIHFHLGSGRLAFLRFYQQLFLVLLGAPFISHLDSSLHDRFPITGLSSVLLVQRFVRTEISNKHIFKNAMVPLVSGIPGAVIGGYRWCNVTETVFAFPGMGKMLIDSIKASNNSMVVGLVFIFTSFRIFSLCWVISGWLFLTHVLNWRIRREANNGYNR